MISDSDRSEGRALLEAATPGPWIADLDIFDVAEPDIEACVSNEGVSILFTSDTGISNPSGPNDPKWAEANGSQALTDAKAIVWLRNHADELLADPALDVPLDVAAALQEIALLTGDMPPAVNDEVGWYRGQFYTAVGIAARAVARLTEASARDGR